MPKYIVLGQFTQKGIENIKDSPKRLEDAKKLAKSLGGKILEFYYTMGRYDFVAVMDLPTTDVMMQALLTTAKAGSVRTETLVAVPAEHAAKEIIGKM
jgi:uncharacterized protein with GYD domain